MIKKLLPVLVILVAAVGGLFAGEMLGAKDDAAPAEDNHHAEAAPSDKHEPSDGHGEKKAASDHGNSGGHGKSGEDDGPGYFRFPSQFFVPVMRGDRLEAVMVLTLSVEYPKLMQEDLYKQEHRMRDALLRALMIHANTGGFDGNYTLEPRMRRLREALKKSASESSGGIVTGILIEDMARQDSA